jgi:DNA polymerase elongation subunit (family B)
MHDIQVIGYDAYMTKSTVFDLEGQKLVPVIRLYGKWNNIPILVHVHKLYPYLLIKINGDTSHFMDKLTRHLKKKPLLYDSVLTLQIIQGRDFYGYTPDWSLFVKLYLCNPFQMTEMGEWLRTEFRLYNGHVSYLSQFVVTFGIDGYITLTSFSMRKGSMDIIRNQVETSGCFQNNEIECQSHGFEVDITPANIMYTSAERIVPGIQTEHVSRTRCIPSLELLWKREASRRILFHLPPLEDFGVAGVKGDRQIVNELGLGGGNERLEKKWCEIKDSMYKNVDSSVCDGKRAGWQEYPTFYQSLIYIHTEYEKKCIPDENRCEEYEDLILSGNESDEFDQFNCTIPDIHLSQMIQPSDIDESGESADESDVDDGLAEMFAQFCDGVSQSKSVDEDHSKAVHEHSLHDAVGLEVGLRDPEVELQISNSPELLLDNVQDTLIVPNDLANDEVGDGVPPRDVSSPVSVIADPYYKLSQQQSHSVSIDREQLDLVLEKELDDLFSLDMKLDSHCRPEQEIVLGEEDIDLDSGPPKIKLTLSDSFDDQVSVLGKRQIPQWDGTDEPTMSRKRYGTDHLKPKKKQKARHSDVVTNTYLKNDVIFDRTKDIEPVDWNFKFGELWSPVKKQKLTFSPPTVSSPTYPWPVEVIEPNVSVIEDLMSSTMDIPSSNTDLTPNLIKAVPIETPKSVRFLPSSTIGSDDAQVDISPLTTTKKIDLFTRTEEATPTPTPVFRKYPNRTVAPFRLSNEQPPQSSKIASVEYQEPYYSNETDIPTRPFVYASRVFKFKYRNKNIKYYRNVKNSNSIVSFEKSDSDRDDYRDGAVHPISQVLKPTQKNTQGFKWTQSQSHEDSVKIPFVTLSMELFSYSNGDLEPNPLRNAICFIAYTIEGSSNYKAKSSGIFICSDRFGFAPFPSYQGIDIHMIPSEKEMILNFVKMVQDVDPDLLVGYEVHNRSWGYLHERAQVYQLNVCQAISKLKPQFCQTNGFFRDKETSNAGEEFYARKSSGLSSTGRIFLNVWRIMRKTLGTTSYTIENAVFHICHQRIPYFKNSVLKEWYLKSPLYRWRVLRQVLDRTKWNLMLLDNTDTIHQTWEFAQVYGMDFYSVLTRGSQFRVESILLRLAQPENFLMFSPGREQVQNMDAPECLALNIEPDSKLYTSPVAVLDFQSLYPSLMVAYNYCYSTCIGKLNSMHTTGYTLGCNPMYQISAEQFEEIKDHVNVAPNGVVFVKPYIRQGLLGKMVSELLETRVMIKQSMKLHKNSRSISRLLDAQQLGIKLLANVTFGYTAASFSGRMPCVDISDAIIQSGRITLEKSIALIHSNTKWDARVVYGDTDSLFVSFPNRSKADAFAIGTEIVKTISDMNPLPIKLKFEKVYLPCILLAKKRYVGFMYETIHDGDPVFDAKGIETVRRDGCPAISKIMENCLKIIFRTKDLSRMKSYLRTEWTNILRGNVIIQDFLIAKEVKMGSYRSKTLPPGAHISKQKMEKDERAEPEYGDRVPFVVVHRGPSHRLIDAVVAPEELINDPTLRLHGIYYITKQIIPPLCRMFNLIGADIESWFNTMPKSFLVTEFPEDDEPKSKRTIDGYFRACHCVVCRAPSQQKVFEAEIGVRGLYQ